MSRISEADIIGLITIIQASKCERTSDDKYDIHYMNCVPNYKPAQIPDAR